MVIDFTKFAVDAIRIIDELRTQGDSPTSAIENPSVSESRINTFYRAIGLPAFTTDDTVQNKKLNSGNFHKTEPNDVDIDKKLSESLLREKKFHSVLDEEDQASFLDNIEETVLSSIKKFDESGKRKKGGIFPMIVNGNIKIYPQSKRVAGAFFKKDFDVNGVIYRRPLIEVIVLLRLRTQGFVSAVDRAKLQDSFPELVDSGFFEGSGENVLTFQILKTLLGAIVDNDGIIKIIDLTVRRLGRIRNNIRETFNDITEATVAEEQPVKGKSDGKGNLEQQMKNRSESKAKNEAMLTLLEYDDTLDKRNVTRNMKDALFAPMMLDAILSDTVEIDRTIEEGNAKKRNLEAQHKQLNKNMDLLMGTYSAISGIDILVIITALFSIDIEDLLGLLNEESMDRLSELKAGVDFIAMRNNKVLDSVEILERKTVEIFHILDGKVRDVHLREESADNGG